MAITVGVYDSGIGGLTTLALLRACLPRCRFYYLADNARMPFGSKSKEEISAAVYGAMKRIRANSDVAVMGCNTASVTVNPEGAFVLRPDLDKNNPKTTLVLGTPLTLAGLHAAERGFRVADTNELAVLTEIQASLAFKSKIPLSMSALDEYLAARLSPFKGVKKVLLGCSHYVYAASRIRNVLGDVATDDGNDRTVAAVCANFASKTVFFDCTPPQCAGEVHFEFTGTCEKAKYEWILTRLTENYAVVENIEKVRKAMFFPR